MVKDGLGLASILERTFRIKTAVDFGTAFIVEGKQGQFLITAWHLVSGESDHHQVGETIRLYGNEGLKIVSPVANLWTPSGELDEGAGDIAVMKLGDRLEFETPKPVVGWDDEVFVPQEVVMPTSETYSIDPHTLGVTTKSGTVARVVRDERRNSVSGDFMVAIEAYPGFSGSPILTRRLNGDVRLVGLAARWSWRTVPEFAKREG